jgi:hypothetical protein
MSLSHSSVSDQVLECDHLGGWWLRKYGAAQFPSSFMEFNGVGYVTMTKKYSSAPTASIYQIDAGTGILADLFITPAYDCDHLGDKEFGGIWVTYRHRVSQSNGASPPTVRACRVYYNVDDLLVTGYNPGGGSFLEAATGLNWTQVGDTTSAAICTDASGTLTTQIYGLDLGSCLTKGMRMSLKFLSITDVDIVNWGILWRPIVAQPLSRLIDPRTSYEEITN